jgi:hypothetical protein
MMDNQGFGEIPFSDLPHEKLATLRQKTADAIHDFGVGIVFDDKLCGSGTLVDVFGSLGVITAYHVVEHSLESRSKGDLCLIVDDRPHRLEVDPLCVEHIPLGVPAEDAKENGPDLSFLKLTGVPLLSTLKSKKSFYRIGGKSFEQFRGLPLEKVFWFVSGTPGKLSQPMTSKTSEGALAATHLIAEATFKSLEDRETHDVLKLRLLAGTSPFPETYAGVSGGGVWLSPLTMDREKGVSSLGIEPCHLAGVVYFQGPREPGERDILANGPKTLESRLKKGL